MTLAQSIALAINVSMGMIVFSLGLRATTHDLTAVMRRPELLLRSLLSMNVVMPALAVALAASTNLQPAVKIAIVALALSPVPPLLPLQGRKAGGSAGYAVGLLAAAAALSLLIVPLGIDLVGRVVDLAIEVPAAAVAPVVIITVLAPLIAGSALRALVPAFAERSARVIGIAGFVLLGAAFVPVLFADFPMIVDVVGNGTLLALALFTLTGVIVGHLLGGPDPDDRTVLALATAARHPGVALAIAGAAFPSQRAVFAVVLWHLVLGAVVARPYIAWRRRVHRDGAAQAVRPSVPADPLPSWREGPAKEAILDFVARVTRPGRTEFIPADERIAVFDNDGTLWCEQPMQAHLYFALDRVADMARRDPSLRDRQPFKAFLERDTNAIAALGKRGAFQIGFATHAGMTAEQFAASATKWLNSARHPQLGRLFKENVYQPQLELLAFLAANDFRAFVVSGGGIDLIRAYAEETYGIPPERVVGSSVKTRLSLHDGRAEVVKLAELDTFDDRETKVENIYLHIGRRPVFAFGNSDGDLAMLRYTVAGGRPGLALLLHHDDAAREFAYDTDFRLSPLVEGLARANEYGITLVSMKKDWGTVFRNGSR